MAYYDALKTQWSLLNPGTTAQKLAQINSMTVTGSIPTVFSVSGTDIYNCLVPSEFQALSSTQQQLVRDIFNLQGSIPAGSGTTAQVTLLSLFGAGTATRANLIVLAKATSTPWWQAMGYSSPFSQNDLVAAGGLS